jgi:hypothetical protein
MDSTDGVPGVSRERLEHLPSEAMIWQLLCSFLKPQLLPCSGNQDSNFFCLPVRFWIEMLTIPPALGSFKLHHCPLSLTSAHRDINSSSFCSFSVLFEVCQWFLQKTPARKRGITRHDFMKVFA